MSGQILPDSRQNNNAQISTQKRWKPHNFYIFSLPVVRKTYCRIAKAQMYQENHLQDISKEQSFNVLFYCR